MFERSSTYFDDPTMIPSTYPSSQAYPPSLIILSNPDSSSFAESKNPLRTPKT